MSVDELLQTLNQDNIKTRELIQKEFDTLNSKILELEAQNKLLIERSVAQDEQLKEIKEEITLLVRHHGLKKSKQAFGSNMNPAAMQMNNNSSDKIYVPDQNQIVHSEAANSSISYSEGAISSVEVSQIKHNR